MKAIPYLVLLTLGSLALAVDKPAAGFAGHWNGAITLPGTKLQIAVDLKADAMSSAWSGTIDIPAQMLPPGRRECRGETGSVQNA